MKKKNLQAPAKKKVAAKQNAKAATLLKKKTSTSTSKIKLTKQAEEGLLKAYYDFWESNLSADMKKFSSYLVDDFSIFGSANGEVFFSKRDAVKFYTATAEELRGKAQLRNRKISIQPLDSESAVVREESDLYVLIGRNWSFYGHARISCIVKYIDGGWKALHQHASFPDHRTEEGQQLASEKIEKENLELRDAVKRRTVELEHKNRELAIEAAMEKVRARSLAMQKPEELTEVAEVLRKEMGALGVEELETSSIYIVNENETTECWYAIKDVRGNNKKLVTDHMTLHLVETWVGREMQKFYRSKQTRTSILMRGKNRKEWINYCADKSSVLQGYYGGEIPERTYHLLKFSNGFMGAASPGEISPESWDLLQRATTVFSFAYKRFSDLQKAEAQAKEAKIEAALERIRARALAMHKSEEFMEVAKVMREQMGYLGQPELETSAVHLYDEDADNIFSWRAFRLSSKTKGNISFGFFKIPKTSCAIAKEFVQKFKSKAKDYTIEVGGAKQVEWYKILFRLAPEVRDAMIKSGTTKEKRYYHFSKFTGGALLMVTSKAPANDAIELQKRSSQVFDLAYRRFKDLQKAEAQAKEAQIQLALERVRARTMAMQKSEELPAAAALLFQQVQSLGMPAWSAGYCLWNDDYKKSVTLWMSSEGVIQPPFTAPTTKDALFIQMRKGAEEGKTLHVVEM
ncbi:MAG: nuclear transport factor 2 family protein, partial [Cyclobacteriaceae bacterium]|nr:nuclear transport factor 2 family protein [Cyclobacteriaceae bacterium]